MENSSYANEPDHQSHFKERNGEFTTDQFTKESPTGTISPGLPSITNESINHRHVHFNQMATDRSIYVSSNEDLPNLLPQGTLENESPQIKRWMCPLCGKVFYSRRTVLNRHIAQVHSKYYPYDCECGHAYKRKDHLRRHWHQKRCRPSTYSLHYTLERKIEEWINTLDD